MFSSNAIYSSCIPASTSVGSVYKVASNTTTDNLDVNFFFISLLALDCMGSDDAISVSSALRLSAELRSIIQHSL
jgi:hypothetical protein